MKTLKTGICTKCKKNFVYSIGTPLIPIPRKSEQHQQNIVSWFESIGSCCYECVPVPNHYRQQCGTLIYSSWNDG